MITSASKAIIAWFLEQQGLSEDDVVTFLETVADGIQYQDQEAIDVHTGLLLQAREASRGNEMQGFIDLMLQYHAELLDVAEEVKKLALLERVREIVSTTPDSAFAKKIATRKITDVLQ